MCPVQLGMKKICLMWYGMKKKNLYHWIIVRLGRTKNLSEKNLNYKLYNHLLQFLIQFFATIDFFIAINEVINNYLTEI